MSNSIRRSVRAGLVPAGVLLLAALAGPAFAAASLTVVGEAARSARPDMAVLSTGVLTTAKTADEALSSNSKAIGDVIAALKAGGIEARDIATANFSIQPQYVFPQYPQQQQSGRDAPKLVGYEVRNAVRVTVRDLSKLGAMMDKVIQAGANQSSGLTFGLSNSAELEQEARLASVTAAMEQAKAVAAAAGLKLIRISSIQPGDVDGRPMPAMPMMMKADAARAPVPVEAGEIEVRARTTVVYEAEPQ